MKIFDDDVDVKNKEKWLKITDFDNFFSIYEDKRNRKSYNLNNTMYIFAKDTKLSEYQVKHDSWWPLISYNLYDTTRLAWLLMKVNDVDTKSMFHIVQAGTKIKYLDKNTIQTILSEVNDFENI